MAGGTCCRSVLMALGSEQKMFPLLYLFVLRSEVLIGKTAEDNDRLSLQYGKPDEALSARTAAYRELHMRVLIVLMGGWTE